MATLPDLDTASVGTIAYYNLVDDAGFPTDFDPTDVTSDGDIIQYTIYDNGLDGTYDSPTGREVNFRVKSDGWYMVWIDRTNTYERNGADPDEVRGRWDFAQDWTTSNSNSDFVNNTLERVINSLANQSDHYDGEMYDATQVSYYDYEHSDAAGITGFSGTSYGNSDTYGLVFTDGTEIYEYSLAASVQVDSGDGGTCWFEGVEIVSSNNSSEYGAVDADQWADLSPGVEYQQSSNTNNGNNSYGNNEGRINSIALLYWG